ncbi:MAG: hypothetical protein K8L99_14225 [Anaerolineae bacterium]|nr:hypothetical protein [Anaerolineae bacterium]
MLPPLLLRLPLVFIVLLVVFNTGIPRWLRAIIAGIGVIALLPPFEFLSSLSDPNYQQQFALAVITFVFGAIGLTDRLRSGVALVVLLIGLVGVSLWGNISAYNMMVAYRLPVQYGLGGVLLTVFGLVHLLWIAKRGSYTVRELPRIIVL